MHIAGGLYREICLRPAWNGLYGSGGRAAMTVASVSGKPTLHTYFEELGHVGLDQYDDRGIELVLSSRRSGVAFSYFHPLSTPYLEPPKPEICEPLKVHGDTVLRYGFVEGDAIVSGRRVIFDPQGWNDRHCFFDNGSDAQELALVLNVQELGEISQGEDITDVACSLIRKEQANVVVVKRGIFGATVIDKDLNTKEIRNYSSPQQEY